MIIIRFGDELQSESFAVTAMPVERNECSVA
jgi:hypothetical protein